VTAVYIYRHRHISEGLVDRSDDPQVRIRVEVRLVVRLHGMPDFRSIDLSPDHILDQVRLVADEAVMPDGPVVRAAGRDALEAVQIELALEGGVFRLLEKQWHDCGHEFFLLVDLEGPSVGLPSHDRFAEEASLRRVGFHAVQHNVELVGKGNGDTALRDALDADAPDRFLNGRGGRRYQVEPTGCRDQARLLGRLLRLPRCVHGSHDLGMTDWFSGLGITAAFAQH